MERSFKQAFLRKSNIFPHTYMTDILKLKSEIRPLFFGTKKKVGYSKCLKSLKRKCLMNWT